MKRIDRNSEYSTAAIRQRIMNHLRDCDNVHDRRPKRIALLNELSVAETMLALHCLQAWGQIEYVGGAGRGYWCVLDVPWFLQRLGFSEKYPSQDTIQKAYQSRLAELARCLELALKQVPS